MSYESHLRAFEGIPALPDRPVNYDNFLPLFNLLPVRSVCNKCAKEKRKRLQRMRFVICQNIGRNVWDCIIPPKRCIKLYFRSFYQQAGCFLNKGYAYHQMAPLL